LTQLITAFDRVKDQTYFLSDTKAYVLNKTLFPIGHLGKSKVKEIAREAGLDQVAKKKESMGICFIGKRAFGPFVDQFMEGAKKKLEFVDENGILIGISERSIHGYVVGQAARIPGAAKRYVISHLILWWWVARKQMKENRIVVVASILKSREIYSCLNFIAGYAPLTLLEKPFLLKYRSRAEAVPGRVSKSAQSPLHKIEFDEPQDMVAAGQQVVLYDENVCLGGGSIKHMNDGGIERF
jgi:tRNA U34 2-thiouridine synthase MnmA/TrmU